MTGMRLLILGCGYVGLELGRQLADDNKVFGVRRSEAGLEAIEEAGIEPVAADLTAPETLDSLPAADWVVFAASSGGRGADAAREVYVEGQQNALAALSGKDTSPERYLYTSSTGVYGDHGGDWVDESTPLDPTTPKTEVLAAAERVALGAGERYGIDGSVARLAGLYGPERYRLERYLEGPVTEGYLNMVHRDDAAGAIAAMLDDPETAGEVVLVVDEEPVDKWAFADWLAEECGIERPPKQTKAERLQVGDLSDAARRRILTSKRCRNDRLAVLGYEYRYPTVRQGYRAALDSYCS